MALQPPFPCKRGQKHDCFPRYAGLQSQAAFIQLGSLPLSEPGLSGLVQWKDSGRAASAKEDWLKCYHFSPHCPLEKIPRPLCSSAKFSKIFLLSGPTYTRPCVPLCVHLKQPSPHEHRQIHHMCGLRQFSSPHKRNVGSYKTISSAFAEIYSTLESLHTHIARVVRRKAPPAFILKLSSLFAQQEGN